MATSESPSLTINWHEYPFVRLLLPLLLGVVIAENFSISNWVIGLVFVAAIIPVLLLAFLRNTKRIGFGVAAAISLLVLAYLRTDQHNEQQRADHFSQFQTEEKSSVIGWVSSMPEEKNWVQFQFKVLQVGDLSASGNIQVYIEKDSLSPNLAYGDLLQIDANLLEASPPKNPNAFDFSKYLHYQNIHYQSFVRQKDWRKIEENHGNSLLRQVYNLRRKLLNILRVHLESEDLFAVGAALTLGYRGAISEEVRNAYANTGAIHVLAVSGLHVGIIAMILFWILRIFPSYTLPQKWLKAGIALLGIWLFTLLTGASASVIRAATMFTFIVLGKYVQRNGNIYNSLAAAAFFSLLINPFLLFQVGFQLSYLAVASIVYFQPKIYRLIYIKNKVLDYLWTITSVSFAAQIAVFPISLYYFHQFPTYFWLSSMIVIPAALVVLLLAIFLFVSQLFLPIMSEIGGEVLEWLLYLMNKAIFTIEDLPFGLIKGVWITWYEVLLWYGLIVAISLILRYQKAKVVIAFAIVFCLLSGSYATRKTKQHFNKSMVVYHSSRETIIDFFDGRTTYALHHPNLNQKTLDFTTQQHRWAMGSKTVHTHFLNDKKTITYDNCWIQFPYIQFYDKRILLLNHPLVPSDSKLEVDYLFIHDNPKTSIASILSATEPQQIVFDASNSQKSIMKWMEDCEQLGVNCYDARSDGAFMVFWK